MNAVIVTLIVMLSSLWGVYLGYSGTEDQIERACLIEKSFILKDNTYRCELVEKQK